MTLRLSNCLRSAFIKRFLIGIEKLRAGLLDGLVVEQRSRSKNDYKRKIRNILKFYYPGEVFLIHELPRRKGQKAETLWLVTRKKDVGCKTVAGGKEATLLRISGSVNQRERFYERGPRHVSE